MPHDTDPPAAVLIVADRPIDPQSLIALMRQRARAHDCRFTLLVPAVAHGLHRHVDPEDPCCAEAQETIDILLPRLERATRAPVEAMIGAHEPLAAIQDALNIRHFDEVILKLCRPGPAGRGAGKNDRAVAETRVRPTWRGCAPPSWPLRSGAQPCAYACWPPSWPPPYAWPAHRRFGPRPR